ncbi:MAG: hypothetical protein IJZ76_05950 [Lachnospiraceae bacterium]|nr:hypothetical protein [Lachnospiraceae bacterium]
MIIKSVNGTIMEVVKIEPIVEKRESFNGTVNRRVAVAKNMLQDISGLLFSFKDEHSTSNIFSPDEGKLLIGNLQREVVEELLDSILKNGYADLSGYSYQPCEDITKLKFDYGKSEPYFIRGFAATMGLECPMELNPFAPAQMGNISVVEDDGDYTDDEPKTAEDMRKDIYCLSDKYTITQLANMNEDELSDILKGIESQF